MVGIVLSHMNGEPRDKNSIADNMAAEQFNQFSLGWFANPIFGDGDYPDVVRWQVGNKSVEQGLPRSRLPAFSEEEKLMVKGLILASLIAETSCTKMGCCILCGYIGLIGHGAHKLDLSTLLTTFFL